MAGTKACHVSPMSMKRAVSRINGRTSQHVLQTQKTVVFGGAFPSAWGAGLDLAGVHGHSQICDRGVLRFTGAMRRDGSVSRLMCHADGVECFRDCADLVELNQDRVSAAQLDSAAQPFGVGDKQIVSDKLLQNHINHLICVGIVQLSVAKI